MCPLLASIVATASSLEDHVSDRPDRTLPLASRVVANACEVSAVVIAVGVNVTLTAPTETRATVRVALPDFPSLAAVICAVPDPTAVTDPSDDTVATAWSLELQITARFVSAAPLASRVVAVATVDSPVISDDLVRETLTDATGIC